MHAPLFVYDGYGSLAEHMVVGLSRLGIDVRVRPTLLDKRGLSKDVLRLIDYDSSVPDGVPHLVFGQPSPAIAEFARHGPVFVNTMWESSLLPAGWADTLNHAKAMIVPTNFVADVARSSGVQVPIHVVPEGIDPSIYPYYLRPPRETFTTLVVGYMNRRKHGDIAVDAWFKAFGDCPDARLLFKARWNLGLEHEVRDPRITSCGRNEPTRGIAHWYQRADLILALGNEGFGLPLIEGMATGLAGVALASEGQKDTCDAPAACVLPVLPHTWELCDDTAYGIVGIRGVPDANDVAETLRYLYEHRTLARRLGVYASTWVHANRSISAKSHALLKLLTEHVEDWPTNSSQRSWIAGGWGSRIRASNRPPLPDSGDYYYYSWQPASTPLEELSRRRPTQAQDPQAVAVVYGRDTRRQNALFDFLGALGLRPVKFSDVLSRTESSAPYISKVVEQLLQTARVTVVLLTPDEEARLRQPAGAAATQLRYRARQNVVFETGLALAHSPDRTILVACGQVELWSDIAGMFVVRTLDRSNAWRVELKNLLKAAGCRIDDDRGDHWLSAGRALDEDPLADHLDGT